MAETQEDKKLETGENVLSMCSMLGTANSPASISNNATERVFANWEGSKGQQEAFKFRMQKAKEVLSNPNTTLFQINCLEVWAITYDNLELQERCEQWKLENLKKNT